MGKRAAWSYSCTGKCWRIEGYDPRKTVANFQSKGLFKCRTCECHFHKDNKDALMKDKQNPDEVNFPLRCACCGTRFSFASRGRATNNRKYKKMRNKAIQENRIKNIELDILNTNDNTTQSIYVIQYIQS